MAHDGHGELIQRPSSPVIPASPIRAYHPGTRRGDYSPERIPGLDFHFEGEQSRATGPGGLRRRPSAGPGSGRRQSLDGHDRPSFSSSGEHSKKPLRARDDGYYRDDDRPYHPDAYERSRPPRTYRNVDGWERGPNSASKPYFDESRGDYRERDLERGEWGNDMAKRETESVDGYDYENHKRGPNKSIDFNSLTPEERKQVLRLPWTQWMNSNVKNRKPRHILKVFIANYFEQTSLPPLESSWVPLCSCFLLSLVHK